MSRNPKTAKGNFDAMLMKPKIDFAFKMLFSGAGEKSALLLTDLLNAIMGLDGDKKITQIEYLNPYIGREYESDKASVMDVKVRTQAGELIDIEMQIGNTDDYRKRTLYYWAKMYTEAATKGHPYKELKKCVVINIMDFSLLYETDNYHSVFVIKEVNEGFKLNDDLELHYIELPKFKEEDISGMDNLGKWLTFLKYAGEEGKESLIEKLREESEVIDMASVILRTMSEDERIRQEYYQREKWAMDKASQAAYIKAKEEEAAKAHEETAKAREEAAKAREEAAEMREKLIKTAINLIQRGFSIKEAADITGLSAEEIEKSQKN